MKTIQFKNKITTIKLLSLENVLKSLSNTKNYYLIDANISKLYQDFVEKLPNSLGKYIITAEENKKTIETYQLIIHSLMSDNVTKDCYLVNIGGGITTDIGGFVAATYKRGMHFINVPTTLLAMVDASIGGKNGLNFDWNKNIIGTIYQPDEILIAEDFLETLAPQEILSGKVEMLKLALLQNDNTSFLQDVSGSTIYRYALAKADICVKDEESKDVRNILNFGHTLGHAFELLLNIEHGIAVGLGMYYITKNKQMQELIKNELAKIGLNINDYKEKINKIDKDKLLEIIMNDKKNTDFINIVELDKLGEPYIAHTTINKLKEDLANELF